MSCKQTPATVIPDKDLLALIPLFDTNANMYKHFLYDTEITGRVEVPYIDMSPVTRCSILKIKDETNRQNAINRLTALGTAIFSYIKVIDEYNSRQGGAGSIDRKRNANNVRVIQLKTLNEIETLINNIESGRTTMGGKSRRKYRSSYKKRIRKHNNTKRNRKYRSQKASVS